MTASLILTYPNPELRKTAESIGHEVSAKQLLSWCKDIGDTMLVNGALGLAAPQIGIAKRIFAVNVSELMEPGVFSQKPIDNVLYFVNPALTYVTHNDIRSVEACLSVPGMQYQIRRSAIVDLTYENTDREQLVVRVSGKDAITLQHEYDHLNGVLFINRLNVYDRACFEKLHRPLKKAMTEEQLVAFRQQRRAALRAKRKTR